MAKNNSHKSGENNEYDPNLEARVDSIMNDEPEAIDSSKSGETSSAPLLPGDALPDFDKSDKNINESEQKPEKKVLAGMVNNISDKVVRPDADELSDNDPKTDKAVDEITASEADRLLAIDDAKAELLAQGEAEIDDSGFGGKIKRLFGSKGFKIFFFSTLIILIVVAFLYPSSRYYILNKFGVRASSSLEVVDDATQLPLKDAKVTIGSSTATSDDQGKVKIEDLKLGPQKMSINKPAFAKLSKDLTIGWGSNPQGKVGITATGSKYTFKVVDFLSEKGVNSAAASSGEANAKADKNGEIILVVADSDKSSVSVEISADNYRSEKFTLKVGDEQTKEVKLVPAKKHAFVSKRDGTFDLYKVDVDGKNQKKILAGTGNENADNLAILAHPTKNLIAYMSTRSDERAKDGEPMNNLSIVDLNDNSVTNVAESEWFQLIDFIDNKLIYVKLQPGSSENDKKRRRIMSYDIDSGQEKEIASSNYFNSVTSALKKVYYSPSEFKVNGSVGFYTVNADGSGRTKILAKEAWNIYRTAYNKLSVATSDKWYEFNIDSSELTNLSGAPASKDTRIYTLSPDSSKSAWVDKRDGKGVLLIYNHKTDKDTAVARQSGLVNPVEWIDAEHLVYRVNTSDETADYVLNVRGGDPKKITDVTNTLSLDRFYFY